MGAGPWGKGGLPGRGIMAAGAPAAAAGAGRGIIAAGAPAAAVGAGPGTGAGTGATWGAFTSVSEVFPVGSSDGASESWAI